MFCIWEILFLSLNVLWALPRVAKHWAPQAPQSLSRQYSLSTEKLRSQNKSEHKRNKTLLKETFTQAKGKRQKWQNCSWFLKDSFNDSFIIILLNAMHGEVIHEFCEKWESGFQESGLYPFSFFIKYLVFPKK